MSYCRWSSDDWACDVYVWHDVSGYWCTEVAGRRWIFTVELPPPVEPVSPLTYEHLFTWQERNNEVMRMHGDEQYGYWYNLPEPEGGRSYDHASPGQCADNLERLRGEGFNVPQGAIDELREDQADYDAYG